MSGTDIAVDRVAALTRDEAANTRAAYETPHERACIAWDYLVSDVNKLRMGPVRRVLETERDRSLGLAATDIIEQAYLIEHNAAEFHAALQALVREGR